MFTWNDKACKKHNQDSFEAVWEHIHGRAVAYPRPQYSAPVLLEPERFAWRPTEGQGSAAWHELGRFNSHGLRLAQLRLKPGTAYTLAAPEQALLLFCQEGTGAAAGERYARWDTLEIQRGESAPLTADGATEFFVFGLPRFSDITVE